MGAPVADGPLAVSQRFVDAIAAGEHTVVWDLMSEVARITAIEVALANGLDRVRATRFRDDVADPVELDEFLRALVAGLRRDLRSVEIDRLTTSGVERLDDDRVAVALASPSTIPGVAAWPAGRVVLSDRGRWLVDRLEPVIAGP